MFVELGELLAIQKLLQEIQTLLVGVLDDWDGPQGPDDPERMAA